MKSRVMILSMLVLGMLLSTTGAGLAVSGLSANNNASVAQYGLPPSNSVLGEQDQGSQDVLPENAGGNEAPGSAVQPARQVESGASPSSGSQLPFTGFAAIPILLGGVALLSTGLVLRRRTRDDHA